MSISISYEQARDLLELAVEERGADHIYKRRRNPGGQLAQCTYYGPDGTPDCIVGWVLNRLGLRYDYCQSYNGSGVEHLISHMEIKCDLKTACLLTAAQIYQDDGFTWGDALANAVEQTQHMDDYPESMLWSVLCGRGVVGFLRKECEKHWDTWYPPKTAETAGDEQEKELVPA